MFEIQCPHCSGDIELDEDASGLFDCPHCNKEFEYGTNNDVGGLNRPQKISIATLSLISLIVLVYGTSLVISGIEEDRKRSEEQKEKGLFYCDSLFGEDDNSETEYCKYEESDDFFYGSCLVIIGLILGISTFITLLKTRVRFEKGV